MRICFVRSKLLFVTFPIGLVFLACSTTNDAPPAAPAPDAGTDSAVTQPGDAGTDADAAIAIAPPVGNKLTNGQVVGITSDDWVIAMDDSNAATSVSLLAAPIQGGAAQTIWTNAAYPRFTIGSRVVLVQTDANAPSSLDAWTSTGGIKHLTQTAAPIAPNAIAPNAIAANGASVVHSANASADATMAWPSYATTGTYDVVVTELASGADTSLETGIANAEVAWVGGFVVVASHAATGDGGAAALYTVDAFDAANGYAKTTLATDVAQIVFPNANGTSVVLIGADGTAKSIAASGGAATTIDTGVTRGLLTLDGTALLYTTTSGALKRSTLSPASPVTLVASGAGLDNPAFSPDGSEIMYLAPDHADPNALEDLYLASTLSPGTPLAIPGGNQLKPGVGLTSGFAPSPGFTASGKYALYDSAYPDAAADSFQVSDIAAQPIAGGPPFACASRTIGVRALFGDKLIAVTGADFDAPTDPSKDQFRRGDLTIIDLAQSPPSSTAFASRAAGSFAISSGRDRVAYAWLDADSKSEVVYVTAIP